MQPVESPSDLSRIIEMAWEDRTPFEAIQTFMDFPLRVSVHIKLTLHSWR